MQQASQHIHIPSLGRPTWSVRQKLAFLMGLMVAAIALFMYLFFPARLEQQAVDAVAAKASSIAEMSAYVLAPALDFDQVDEVDEALKAARQFEDVLYAYVQDERGAFVTSFRRDSASVPVALGARDGIGPYRQVYHVSRPITSRSQVIGYLYLGFSLEPLHQALNRGRILLAIVSLLVFIVGVGATYGISVFLTRPLGEIVRTADHIAQGDLAQRATVESTDEMGRLASSFNAMVDSLERAYDALSDSESRFRAVIEHTTDIIILIGPDGALSYVSPAVEDVLGYPAEALTGTSALDHVHPDDQDELGRILAHGAADPGLTLTAEARWRHADGSWRFLSHRGKNLLSYPGIESILVSARDVTENKQAERELIRAKDQAEEMARLKSSFLANMSHEIRTPLTGILGFAEILADEVGADQREWVTLIERSSQRLMNTLNSVLDLAQLEARSMKLDEEYVDLTAEVEEIVRLFEPMTPEGVRLEVIHSQAPAYVTLDRSGLQRVLNNLVGNALKFTKAGRVTVAMEASTDHVRLRVEDTGIGIDREFLPHLFDEFKQESTGINRSHEGNGLGLAITRQLTELMGGTISVESVKGLGSIFTVTFPRVEAPAEPAEASAKVVLLDRAAQPPVADGGDGLKSPSVGLQLVGGRSVLVVEDNGETRTLLEQILRAHYRIESAASGDEGLALAKSQRYDAVLMDINLGNGKDGVTTMQDLRRDLGYGDVPIIALTARAMPGDEKRLREAGFDDYLSKPFQRQELLRLLEDNLGAPHRAVA